jgi:hypothetical protein
MQKMCATRVVLHAGMFRDRKSVPRKYPKAKFFNWSPSSVIVRREGDPVRLRHRTLHTYTRAFTVSTGLYYGKPPSFEQVLTELGTWAARLLGGRCEGFFGHCGAATRPV